ncbi:MAG: hypothetical protein M1813_008945 [Trichoglossum hirsutum]|nr:MAG: hypothetical protein M1813_008945 [Trichoglossum hirsutum]
MATQIPAPDPGKLNGRWILDEILDHLDGFHADFPEIEFDILSRLLREQLGGKHSVVAIDPETQMRGFLQVFQATPVFQDAFKRLDPTMKKRLHGFIAGRPASDVVGSDEFRIPMSPQARHHLSPLDIFRAGMRRPRRGDKPIIYEDEAQSLAMEVHEDAVFENWGLTVKNTPRYTFVPRKILGLQNLVRYAKENKLRVRCSGYRHSWSSTFSADGEVLVSLLNLDQATVIPDVTSIFPATSKDGNELKIIELATQSPRGTPDKRLVRVGVAVTNEEFRRWAVANNAWALPVDVVLVEVTIGGTTGSICHGAGRRHKTIPDLIRMIEYVDANGEHQSISDPHLLTAAAGCFGLLGVVTHVTFELDAMTYAVMKPLKPDIGLAIPPLTREDVPFALRKTWTDAQLQQAQGDFERRAADDYYSEWFWFTYQQQAWVNTWNTTTDPTGVIDYPPGWEVWLQWIQGWLGQVINDSAFFKAIPGRWQAQLLATTGMVSLPPHLGGKDAEIKTYLTDALHFRRGVQNMRVRDMEFQIPIPMDTSGKPDFSVVQRAWWDVINLVYEDAESPMRLTLELRIVGSSDLVLSPQHGNDYGTVCIEVLSIPDAVSDAEWEPFMQRVADKWMSYEHEGKKLNVRPHWSKEWEKLDLAGMPAKQYLKTVAYKDEIPAFKDILEEIGKVQGWTLDDVKARFSNALWDYLVFQP